MVVTAVIKMGRRRVTEASISAERNACPSSRSWLANSTIKIPFLAAKPISSTKPTWLYIFSD